MEYNGNPIEGPPSNICRATYRIPPSCLCSSNNIQLCLSPSPSLFLKSIYIVNHSNRSPLDIQPFLQHALVHLSSRSRSTMKSSTQFKLDQYPSRQEEGSLKFKLLPSQADLSPTNHGLELSLSITSTATAASASGTTTTNNKATCKTWTIAPLPETLLHNGFIHPWSLAARQHKAVLEQLAHRKHNHTTSSSSPPSSSSASLLPR